ncbi:MAG: hypothetical protein Q8Q32_01025 [bacterium]|nr:hypothetical protein [bacterium]
MNNRGVQASLCVEGGRAFVRLRTGVPVNSFGDERSDKQVFSACCPDPELNGSVGSKALNYLRKQILNAAANRDIDLDSITFPEGW